jgi:hypothetical protein
MNLELERYPGELKELRQAIAGAEQETADWDLSNSATVERARKVVKLITGRNQNAWSETDRETVHAINALINFAVMQFHRANTAQPVDWQGVAADQAMTIAMMKMEQKREWVGLTDHELQVLDFNDPERGKLARAAEAKLKEKNA